MAVWPNSFFHITLRVRLGMNFSTKKSSLKDLKDTWFDAVFDADSEYVKKSANFYDSFQKPSVVFQRSSRKPILEFYFGKDFAYENMRLGLGYQ